MGRFGKTAAISAASAVLVFSLAGCGGGSVAATVNGEEISEDRVTSYITSLRSAYSLTDDTDWADYLTTIGATAGDLREDAIYIIAEEMLVAEAAEAAGYIVDESEIDAAIEQIKSQYDSDTAWNAALSSQGTSEEQLREDYRNYMYQQIVMDDLLSDSTPSYDQIQEAIDANIEAYDGAKRSSHILFDLEDVDIAETVLAELKDGADFAEMAQEYSIDSSSSSGGDVGWDCEATFVDAYQEALDQLSVGEMTQELVESDYGYHIILCTEEYSVSEEESPTADNIPSSIYETIYDDLVESLKEAEYETYVETLLADAEIVINEMPSGLSYDVDGSAEAAASDDATTEETTDSSTETTE